MKTTLTELELDALRELANIGSGTAATALSHLIGRSIDVSVPNALALPLIDAVEELGRPDEIATSVALPIVGELEGTVLLLFPPDDARAVCRLLGVEAGTELGTSALAEVGNILGTAYLNALAAITGLAVEPAPPRATTDTLGAIVAKLTADSSPEELALLLDSDLLIEDEPCSFSFVLVPTAASVGELLRRLGLG